MKRIAEVGMNTSTDTNKNKKRGNLSKLYYCINYLIERYMIFAIIVFMIPLIPILILINIFILNISLISFHLNLKVVSNLFLNIFNTMIKLL